MSIRYLLMLLLSLLTVNEILSISDFENYFTLSGQIIYPVGSHATIPWNTRLIIELNDISVTNSLFKTIGQTIIDIDVFPISFNLTYAINDVIQNHIYVLNARIIDRYSNILFTNSKRIQVKLLGGGRTTFIDIPIAPIPLNADYVPPLIKFLKWPELVGTDGDEAVEIIKNETGYKNVFTVKEGSNITKDLRYDRVCIFVDEDNKVIYTPSTG